MEEERALDMEQIKKDAEDAERIEEEAKRKRDAGSYTHVFEEPFSWNGQEYEALTFDFKKTTGEDHLAAEHEVIMRGLTLVRPAFNGDFLTGLAARACTERDDKGMRKIDSRAIRSMPIRDFQAITQKTRDFLLNLGS